MVYSFLVPISTLSLKAGKFEGDSIGFANLNLKIITQQNRPLVLPVLYIDFEQSKLTHRILKIALLKPMVYSNPRFNLRTIDFIRVV